MDLDCCSYLIGNMANHVDINCFMEDSYFDDHKYQDCESCFNIEDSCIEDSKVYYDSKVVVNYIIHIMAVDSFQFHQNLGTVCCRDYS